MEPLAAALIGHLIGDWVVQTDAQAAGKSSSWAANQRHMLGYHLTLGAVLALSTLPLVWWLATIAVSWVTHSFIDRRWPVAALMRATGSAPFSRTSWGPMVVDQALHISILLAMVSWA